MKKYEVICVFHPSIKDEKIDEIISKTEKKIKDSGGTVEKTDKIGNKRLASEFQNARKVESGNYVITYFKGEGDLPGVVNAHLKYTEELIRYFITISKTEEAEKVEVELPGAEVEEAPKA